MGEYRCNQLMIYVSNISSHTWALSLRPLFVTKRGKLPTRWAKVCWRAGRKQRNSEPRHRSRLDVLMSVLLFFFLGARRKLAARHVRTPARVGYFDPRRSVHAYIRNSLSTMWHARAVDVTIKICAELIWWVLVMVFRYAVPPSY